MPLVSSAQDSTVVVKSNISLFLVADYGKAIESLFQKQRKWEFGIGLRIKEKYNFVAEYGYGQLNPESVINNGTYTSDGNYFRGGFEYVFTVTANRYLGLGILYAHSKFSDQGTVIIVSDLWEDLNETFIRGDLTADWIEWTINTEAPITNSEDSFLRNFYWGMKFRLRFLVSDISQPDFDIFAIPGYGQTYSPVVPAANFFIKYRLDF